jgi:Domain of unknown function (DUF4253)
MMMRRSILAILSAFFSSVVAGRAQTPAVKRPDAGKRFELDALNQMMKEQGITEDQIVRSKLDTTKIPYESFVVSGKSALAKFEELKNSGRGIPVIVGTDEDLAMILELSEDEALSPTQIIRKANALGVDFDIRKHLGPQNNPDDVDSEDEEFFESVRGDWPSTGYVIDAPTVISDASTGEMLSQVRILLVPAKSDSELPAYLKWGAWNECPEAQVHVAMLRKWKSIYDTELVGLTGEVMNLRVRKRPQNRAEALELALEMFAYCPDIVVQGTETVEALAASLLESDYWYFWWD